MTQIRKDLDVQTTQKELFSAEESAQLAQLIHKRFGRDPKVTLVAWNRLMQVNITSTQLAQLMFLADPVPKTTRCAFCEEVYTVLETHSCTDSEPSQS